ncbi:hypothetical protein T484DRAFT_1755540 [Baffinella frigidus]|nr:hypothetical protein T484DRAFT_1755540 [Cryptophyta sp. CCMP2293]
MADIVPGAVDPDGGNRDDGDAMSMRSSDYGSSGDDMSDSDNDMSATRCDDGEQQRRLRSRQEIFEMLDREYVPAEIMRVRAKISANGFLENYGGTCTRFEGASDLAEACVWLNALTSDDAWLDELRVSRRLPLGPRLRYGDCRPSAKTGPASCRKKRECTCNTSFRCEAILAFMSGLLSYQTTETATKTPTLMAINVVDFMVQNIAHVDAPGFVRLLRAHIFACAFKLNKFAGDMPEYLKDPEYQDVFNALQLSARSNLIPLVVMRTLLEARVDVDSTTRGGRTSLMLVMCGSHTALALEKVKLLLEYGAHIDAYDDGFRNVLHYAVDGGFLDGLRLVLEARRKIIKHEHGRQGRQLTGSGAVHRTAERWGGCRITGLGHWPLGDDCVGAVRPLYIDPLHMPDAENQTPLTIATGICLRPYSFSIKHRNERRKEIIKMLLDAGSDADFDLYRPPCAPDWEHMEMRIEAVREERIDNGWESYELNAPLATKPPFLCHGAISGLKCRNGTTLIRIAVRKEFYDVCIWVGADVVREFIDIENSDFPEDIEDEELGKMFSTCKGARFDFYESEEYVSGEFGDEGIGIPGDMPKIDGADLDIFFDVPDSFDGEYGDTVYRTKALLSSDKSPKKPWASTIKIALRFPRGPYPSEFDDAGPTVLRIETTVREHLTCLQHAAKCPFQQTRNIMIRSAMSMCNPLLEDSCGRSAAQIMEKTLAEAEASNLPNQNEIVPGTPPWDRPQVYKLPSKTDRHLLERMKKDQDAMLAYLNLDVLEKQPHIEITPDLPVKIESSEKKPRVSPFHQIPVDVCRMIHSFVVAK